MTGGDHRTRRRERQARRHFTHGLGVNITSMMDMFTLILIFLLYFFDPDSPDPSVMQLASSTLLSPARPALIVSVGPRELRVNGAVVATVSRGALPDTVPRDGRVILPLVQALQTALPSGTDQPLTVACDRATPYTLVADVLQSLHVAGFTQYHLLVQSSDVAVQPG